MTTLDLSASLTVEVATPAGRTATGHLSGEHGHLTLEVDDPALFAGSGDSAAVRGVAEELATRGISVRVVHDGVHLVTFGAVTAPWWQRRATGSRRIRVGSWRGAWTSLRSRAGQHEAVLPSAEALPPPTLLPLLPTLARHPRRPATTTHNPPGSGAPRLILQKEEVQEGERQPVFWLGTETTTIGSDPSCDVVLPDIALLQAVVVHDETDEYLLESRFPGTHLHGAVVEKPTLLRTGARVDVGPHSLAFFREEYADHGRPYGGRQGGEIGHQRSQPPRPSVQGP